MVVLVIVLQAEGTVSAKTLRCKLAWDSHGSQQSWKEAR